MISGLGPLVSKEQNARSAAERGDDLTECAAGTNMIFRRIFLNYPPQN